MNTKRLDNFASKNQLDKYGKYGQLYVKKGKYGTVTWTRLGQRTNSHRTRSSTELFS